MIRLNLLRSLQPAKKKKSSKRPLFIVLTLLLLVLAGGGWVYFKMSGHEDEGVPLIKMAKRIIPVSEKVETPFDVVEDIVDDIHGGRFKVNSMNRLSSPSHLSPMELKLFERLFVRNAFLVFNSAIRPGMGFNTISLDAEGAFFIFGITPDEQSALQFQEEIKASNAVSSADELSFERRFGEPKRQFALKGFLSYSFIDAAYDEEGAWQREESYKNTREQVAYDMMKLAESRGVRFKKSLEWTGEETFSNAKRYRVQMQIESGYPALMRWFSDLAETGVQVGFTRVNLTSLGGGRILSVVEAWVYSKN